MKNLIELDSWDDDGRLRVIVEAPRGSTVKLKYNPAVRSFELQRFISSAGYPYDWGFVPSTLAEDGDPLDAFVMHEGVTWPGVIIPSICIGVLKLTERKEDAARSQRNDRLIAVPAARPVPFSISEFESDLRERLEAFFIDTGKLAKKRVSIEGWGGPSEAAKTLARATAAYSKSGEGSERPSSPASPG
jgi:inorganic pyrophosphatase